MKTFYEYAAAKKIDAYVVLDDGMHVATIRAHHGEGTCYAEIAHSFDWMKENEQVDTQRKFVRGIGLDLFMYAIAGMNVADVVLTDDGSFSALTNAGYNIIRIV